ATRMAKSLEGVLPVGLIQRGDHGHHGHRWRAESALLASPSMDRVLPTSSCLSLTDHALVTTAVRLRDDRLVCRLYESHGERRAVALQAEGLVQVGLHALGGVRIEQLGPFQIGTLTFLPIAA